MTSSCFMALSCHKPVGPRRGPLQASMGFHKPRRTEFGLGMAFLGPHGGVGAPEGGRCKNPSMKSLPGRFMPKKRRFWSRNLNYPRFFALFLDLLGHVMEILSWALQKRGARSILVVGGSLHVIESTSFSSPTGLSEPPRAPGDPPGDPPRRVLEIIFFFFKIKVCRNDLLATCSPSHPAAARPGVTARYVLTVSYRLETYTFLTMGAEDYH